MIINCPQCNARFLVPDAKIPFEGRTVRCGNCSNQWHVENPAAKLAADGDILLSVQSGFDDVSDDGDRDTSFDSVNKVPALSSRRIPLKPFKILVPVLVLLWLVLALFTYFPHWVSLPVLQNMYGIFGVAETQGLAFANVHLDRETAEAKTKFIFTGSIVNHAAVTRSIPNVRVALKDKDGKVIWQRDYPVKVTLKAGEVYPFRIVNVETAFADRVATIVLDLGNGLELIMR